MQVASTTYLPIYPLDPEAQPSPNTHTSRERERERERETLRIRCNRVRITSINTSIKNRKEVGVVAHP